MRDIFFDLSVRSVRLNFLRSVLASVGIVIGVVAISSMGMLGANMQLQVKSQLSANANTIVILPDSARMGPPGTFISSQSLSQGGITKSQLTQIRTAVGSDGMVIPIISNNTQFVINSVPGRGSLYALEPNDIGKFLTITSGTNIGDDNEVLVGATIAANFNVKTGTRIRLGSSSEPDVPVLKVAGILEQRGTTSDNINADNAIFVSKSWYTDQYNALNYTQVNVIVHDIDTINATETAIDAKLNNKKDVLRITDSSSRLSTISSTIGTLSSMMMAIGAISLVVAAVSIFNVMMMSVNERVQEIGILLSIGTEKGEVRRMFLYEAFILGIVGGGFGAAASLVIGYSVVSALLGTTEYFFLWENLVYLPVGLAVGIVVCIFSGLYPAWRASNMDPIDALRAD
ncbi:MAG: ABC transporter permease [Methanoregulaceae archaeon]|jgi:putative ABC transport system permease protein|nr:ABC transporter permease [Methanoregulaceae archaeon]